MATSWQYARPGQAILTVTSPCTNAQCLAGVDEITGDPRWVEPRRLLIDRREAAAHTREEVEQVLGGLSNRPALQGALVIVVVGSQLAYGAVRMAQILAESQELAFGVEVVKDYEEGRRLLEA